MDIGEETPKIDDINNQRMNNKESVDSIFWGAHIVVTDTSHHILVKRNQWRSRSRDKAQSHGKSVETKSFKKSTPSTKST